VADSCDAVQLLLLPAYCFLLLTEDHQNTCVANITVGIASRHMCFRAALSDSAPLDGASPWQAATSGRQMSFAASCASSVMQVSCRCLVMQLLQVLFTIRRGLWGC